MKMLQATASRRGRVLVLGTDQRVVLAAARSLGRHGIEVHLGWSARGSIASRSRYVTRVHELPPYHPSNDAWKNALLQLLAHESFDLVIPCNDSTLVPLMAHRTAFASFRQIHLLPDHVFSIVSDKFETYQLAQSQGVNLPRGCVVDGSANPEKLIAEYGLPLILKPHATVTVDNAGQANVVRKVCNRAQLEAALDSLGQQKVLIQEHFVGRGVGVEMLVREGEILFAFQHARLHETMEWGSSYRKSVEVSPELLEAARRMMRAIGYTGAAMAEFIVDPLSGRWVFLEINGRFWGSLPLAVAAGADFPLYLYEMLVEGKRHFPVKFRHGVRCRNLSLDLDWMQRRYVANGWRKCFTPFKVAVELASLFFHRDHLDSFSLDDPLPQLAELRELVNRAWRKASKKLRTRSATERVPDPLTTFDRERKETLVALSQATSSPADISSSLPRTMSAS